MNLKPAYGRLSLGSDVPLQALIVAALFVILSPAAAHADAQPTELDLTKLPFEQLVNTEIISATKLTKQVSEASSAVSIVTADDIRAYGYRSIQDILGSMRGLMTVRDPNDYSYLGGRGFGSTDYAGRITLLIDGLKVSDNVFGQSYFGMDGILDVELIERVEYIPGAGSAIYGNGAFLGVVNVITKKGRDFDGAQVSQEIGSHHWDRSRLTYGKQFDNGLDLLMSGSSYSNGGRLGQDADRRSPWFGENDRLDVEQNHRLFLKASLDELGIEAGWVRRPSYSRLWDQRPIDQNTFATVTYDKSLSSGVKMSAKGGFGEYLFNQIGSVSGRWNNFDVKFVGSWFDRHTLVFGAEHRDDYQQRIKFSGWPLVEGSLRTESFYAYDDYELLSNLQLNYGARYERLDDGRETLSPRAGLILKPWGDTVLKLSSGVANRTPTAFEHYSASMWLGAIPWQQRMRTERVLLNELVWEQRLGPRTQLLSSVYRYRTDGRSVLDWENGVLVDQKTFSTGADVEIEHNWDDGRRLKASYAWQDSTDKNGQWMELTPRHLAKFNLATPMFGERLRLGFEAQAVGRRLGYKSQSSDPRVELGGYGLANLTFTSSQAIPGWEASFSIRNLFDRSYSDLITGDGRNVWLQLSRNFK